MPRLHNRHKPYARQAAREVARWAAVLLFCLIVAPAAAITPSHWVFTTEAGFEPGHTQDTVVTNLGDIKLARRTVPVRDLPEQPGAVYDMQALPNGDVFFSVGPECSLFRKRGDSTEKILDLPGEQVFSLSATKDGQLLVAVSAPSSRLAILQDRQLTTVVELPGVRYIWDVLMDDSDTAYLATGTEGKLLMVKPITLQASTPPQSTELLDTAQNNLLCLGKDDNGRLYIGSDTDGLVYRAVLSPEGITKAFVLYDAPEPEIGALRVMKNGTVYAGTSDADQAQPGRLEGAAETEAGRPGPGTPEEQPPGDLPPQIPPKPDPIDNPHSTNTTRINPSSTGQKLTGPTLTAPQVTPLQTTPRTDEPSITSPPEQQPIPSAGIDLIRESINQKVEDSAPQNTLVPPVQPNELNEHPATSPHRKAAADSRDKNTSKEGNAVYRIDPDGFVTEVFRESVMILDLLEDPDGSGQLLVATGNEGELFSLDPTAEETSILADLEPPQITRLSHDSDGHIWIGTANPATIMKLESDYAPLGTYTGHVLDAGQVSLWGKLHLAGTIPTGTSVVVQTRSGNVEDPDQAAWSEWSIPQTLEHASDISSLTPRELTISSPPARFLQYQLTLKGNTSITPIVDRVQLAYIVPNLKPEVTSIQASYSSNPDIAAMPNSLSANTARSRNHEPILNITWEAIDPNNDQLLFTLEYQPEGTSLWLPLATDLTDTTHTWDTRFVPDGRYTLRIVADDSPDNTPDMSKQSVRLSDPIGVDNTPPTLNILNQYVEHNTGWIAAVITDSLSSINAIYYNVDSNDLWHAVTPDDLIYDSTRETFSIKITDLATGQHAVTIRTTDSRGNTLYRAVFLEVK
jgi:hypothetical protein